MIQIKVVPGGARAALLELDRNMTVAVNTAARIHSPKDFPVRAVPAIAGEPRKPQRSPTAAARFK